MAYKNLQNRTGKVLHLEVTPRMGDEPVNSGQPIKVTLQDGDDLRMEYGDDQNPYLNGVSMEYNITDDAEVRFSKNVVKRGSDFDNELNQNDTLTFNAVAENVVQGSNS